MTWLWLAAAVVLAAAAFGVWYAFQRPEFVAGLTAVAAGALWKALRPRLGRKSAADEAIDHQHAKEGTDRPTKLRPHPGERGWH